MAFKFSGDKIIRYVQRQLRIHNQSYNIIFTGMCGTGKSYAGLEFCCLVDPKFSIERVAFSEEEFMRLLKAELPKGSAILWDEAGVGLDSREFMSVINKMLSYVAMTMRHRNLCVVFTVPSMQYVDKKAREMLHAYVEMLGVDGVNKVSTGKMFILQTNYRYGKTYFHSPTYEKQGMPYVVNPVLFKKPSETMLREYEDKKMEFTRGLYDEALDKITGIKNQPTKKRKYTNQEIINYVRENRKSFVGKTNVININKVALHFNLGIHKARQVKALLKADGQIRTTKKRIRDSS